MKTLVLIFLFFGAAWVWREWQRMHGGKSKGAWPYRARKMVLTEPEQILFWRIEEALPGMVVLAQVALSRVIEVERGTQNKMKWFGKISQKSLDYVVCRKDMTIVAAIELDDASHWDAQRQKGDADKGKALADAGVVLIRWSVKDIPDLARIKAEIAKIVMSQQQKHVSPMRAVR